LDGISITCHGAVERDALTSSQEQD